MTKSVFTLGDVVLAATTLVALATLPPALVPWPWIAGYALPAGVLLLVQRFWPRRQAAGAVVAMLTLLGAGAGLRAFVPAGDAAPIACILVAPLTYFCLRRQPGDERHALFLAVCVLVVGSVLDLTRARLLAIPFAVGATLSLLLAARAAVRTGLGPRTASVRRRAWGLRAAQVTVAVLLTAASLFQLLTIAPVPSRDYAHGADDDARAKTQQGLSDRFDLGATDGWLQTVRDLRAPRLAAVRRDDGATPPDLYLRFVYFDLAGANRWATAKCLTRPQPEANAWTLFEPQDGWRTIGYTIEREPMTNGNLLLPESAWRVEGIGGLLGHEGAGVLRESTASTDTITYRTLSIAPTPHMPKLRVDPYARHLLSLPEALQTGDVARLAERYAGGVADDLDRALTIARHLRHDYGYARRDPTGPWPDVLHNFLFHTHAGYCMHFASALAVMLRLQGVPCRIGAGLYGGREDERPGWRVYGDSDAHAWVEVPCVGAGWVVIDATPAEVRGASGREAGLDTPAATDTGDEALGAAGATELLPRGRWPLAALFLVSLVAMPLLRRGRPLASSRASVGKAVVHPARHLLAATLSRLAHLGMSRRQHETLSQLATRAQTLLDVDAAALLAGFRAYEDLRFGRAVWSQPLAERLRTAAAAAAKAKTKSPT